MRIPFLKKKTRTPLEEIQAHTKKIKECIWTFQQALECYSNKQCDTFEELRKDVIRMANESHAIKEQIRSHFSDLKRSKINIHLLLSYLKHQSGIVDSIETALEWMSFRTDFRIPQSLERDFFLLVDSVIEPTEDLVKLLEQARNLMVSRSAKNRKLVLKTIEDMSNLELEAKRMEERMKRRIFSDVDDTLTVFHLVRLTDVIGSISKQTEHASDIIRAMVEP